MGGSQQQRQFVHLAEKSCPQVLTINFLTIARHSLVERLKIGTLGLVVQTIPSLNCLYVKARLAAEHQGLGAEAVRDFRLEKEDKTAGQLLCKKEIGVICEMKGRIGHKLSLCSHHFCNRGSLDNLLSKLMWSSQSLLCMRTMPITLHGVMF